MSGNNPAPAVIHHCLIPTKTAQALLAYLSKRPYEEVAGFITILSSMKQAEFPPKGPSDPGGATGNNGEQAVTGTGKKAGKK